MPLEVDLARLEALLALRAPTTLSTLSRPATDADIGSLETSFGADLRPEVQTLLRWHNGCEQRIEGLQLWPGFYFIGTERILSEWTSRNEVLQDYPESGWNPRWLPIASDWCGGHLVVDHTPGNGGGDVFAAFLIDGRRGLPIEGGHIANLQDLIGEVLASLENGRTVDAHNPRIVDGYVSWVLDPSL
ncbi:hypothetical protein Val02_82480 [Virgisporangium aliadipatigenens]|uniref:Knr4/Smi1-like domain-containing protein n=1 Tax=Virgisporangium aliadipatigenens TaxID=741659 RepID=A0A8J3YVD0_9ACTN|nr:SMI1/KNR4 family protein [Virgisporangium aliadipatigenens]GIJ51362.1 hypothetical protein Val02_82480 [Virgisporangium aliadipatigenens]